MGTSWAMLICIFIACQDLFAPAANASEDLLGVRDIWQFPNETWVENIAVRANGQLLVTLLTTPDLYQVNPFKPEHPILVHRFPNVVGALGIIETEPDIFAIITGNFTATEIIPGSYSVWRVDMRSFDKSDGFSATVSKIATIADSQLLNGATLLEQGSGTILIADTIGGLVWALNTRTGVYDVVLEDDLMKPLPGSDPLGINGLHVRENFLYFTNTGQQLLARVPIHWNNGTAAGPYEVVANIHSYCDDFVLASGNIAYVATGINNAIVTVDIAGEHAGTTKVIAGELDSTVLAGTTAAAFGRTAYDRSILYVTTNGGIGAPVNGSIIQGGKVSAINIGALK